MAEGEGGVVGMQVGQPQQAEVPVQVPQTSSGGETPVDTQTDTPTQEGDAANPTTPEAVQPADTSSEIQKPIEKAPVDIQEFARADIAQLAAGAAGELLFTCAASTQLDLQTMQGRKEKRPARMIDKKFRESQSNIEQMADSPNPKRKAFALDAQLAPQISELQSTYEALTEHRSKLIKSIRQDNPDMTPADVKNELQKRLAKNPKYMSTLEGYNILHARTSTMQSERMALRDNGQVIPDQVSLAMREAAKAFYGEKKPLTKQQLYDIATNPIAFGAQMMEGMLNNPSEYKDFAKGLVDKGILTKEEIKDFKQAIDIDPHKNPKQIASYAFLFSILFGFAVKQIAEDELNSGGGQRR